MVRKAWLGAVVVLMLGPSLGVIAGSVATTVPAATPPGLTFGVESLNWAGYAVTGSTGSVTKVTGSWIQPAVKCTSSSTYAAFWDGIDGYGSDTVEQGGSLAYCVGGSAYYYAWYEFYPAASVGIPSITVHPGDKISVTVTYSKSASDFSIKVQDGSQSYTKTGTVIGAERRSAECIAERPEVGSTLAHLADFASAEFGADHTATIGCGATVSGTTASLGSFATVTAINMVDTSGKLLSTTSALSSDRSSFTETWDASS